MMSDTTITSQLRHQLGLPGRVLSAAGAELSLTDMGGPAPVVVCLHAAGHGSRDFESLRQLAAGRLRIITLDWPGHGRSGEAAEQADVARYATLLTAVLDQLKLGPVVLLGNSVGGGAALTVAAARPDLVAGLVLCNAGGLAAPHALVRGFTAFMAWAYRCGATGGRWFPWFFSAQYRLLLPGRAALAQRRRIVAAGREHAEVLAQLWASFGEPVNDVRPAITALRCPVLLAWARHDPFNNHRMVAAALSRFEAPLHLFEGGHAPFLEQPTEFYALLERFVLGLPQHVSRSA